MAIKIHGGEDNPLIQCINPSINKWMVLWPIGIEDELFTFMAEFIDHKPTIEEIKNTILNWHNQQIDQKILSGFKWRDIPVWLSVENQLNYKAAYDLAVQSGGEYLPIFKLGTTDSPIYFKFDNFEDLKDFYTKAMTYISETLANGWKEKDSINWNVYSEVLNKS